MKTVNKLRLLGYPDDVLSSITDFSTTDLINDAIIGLLMVVKIKSDVQALKFCDVMDNLVDNKSSETHIEIFKNGN